MSDFPELSELHLKMLREESGIGDAVITARGYRSIPDSKAGRDELKACGFAPRQRRVPGLLIPLHTTDGQNGCYVYRPDSPRVVEVRSRKNADGTYPQKVIKYEQPKGEAVRVDCPPQCRPQLADPQVPLFITEGQKKADALVSRGACAIALTGVWNWKSRNQYGGTTFTNDLDYVAWENRTVYIVFDSDVMTKAGVRQALVRFTEHLQRKKAQIQHIYLPKLASGKTGVDDWFAANPDSPLDDLVRLAQGPRPEVKAAPPVVELLDEAPKTISRPLALIDGRGYVAAWPWTRITQPESPNKRTGEIIRHDPPLERKERRLVVVRDDGVLFGDGIEWPLRELGLEVNLPETPLADNLLSTPALKQYCGGRRPEPLDVFERIVAVIDRFIDFDRSLASQRTMAELVACFVLATWFLDAFTVASNLWPNGDRGSGKTQLLLVVCAMAYLGQVVLAGGSFATLRDLADYGATIGFDDAENLTNPRQTDPDKRTLLLAGIRRGNTVTLKEKDSSGAWVTRHVNTFSFRLFSAIRLPDNVLASRTIIVPLIRTPDRERANADPQSFELWPHDRRELVDDLWCLALANLSDLKRYETAVNAEARLTGRHLEPWRAILAIAKWLDDKGAVGLWQRMEQLAVDYQDERPDLEVGDFQGFIIRGLLAMCANRAGCANCANHVEYTKGKPHWVFASNSLAECVATEIKNAEADLATDHGFGQRVGMALKKMRLYKPPRAGGKGPRSWLITADELIRWALSYGIAVPENLENDAVQVTGEVGTVGTAGTVGTQTAAKGHEADLWEGVV